MFPQSLQSGVADTDTRDLSAFKFLPVLGEYMSLAIKKQLPASLASKWRFRTEHQGQRDTFVGDGSRGGPARRELDADERARLAIEAQAKL